MGTRQTGGADQWERRRVYMSREGRGAAAIVAAPRSALKGPRSTTAATAAPGEGGRASNTSPSPTRAEPPP